MIKNQLCTAAEAAELILSGRPLLAAASPSVLKSLPKGSWIGGSTPYFMDPSGCRRDEGHVFVTELPVDPAHCGLAHYGPSEVGSLLEGCPSSAAVFLILPAFSEVHRVYAEEAPEFPGMFMQPVVGWVSGVAVEEIGQKSPEVFYGPTGESWTDRAVVLWADFGVESSVSVDIVNLFTPGSGPVITFNETGFSAGECLVGGQPQLLSDYIGREGVDIRLPLVADMGGALINTSIAGVESENGKVTFYAPVFEGVEYRFADGMGDYASEFTQKAPSGHEPIFSCNCILNYLYGGLEGKPLGGAAGPITFGEIAYQLLNQTMVYVDLDQAA